MNKKDKNRILITGGAGFLGFHLAKHLIKDERNEILLVDNLWRGSIDSELKKLLKNKNIDFIEADISKLDEYKNIKGAFDDIYHLAAINGTETFYKIPHEVLRVNILSLMYLLEWMKDNSPKGKIMFTSSNEAYSSNLEAFNDLKIPTPENVPLSIADVYNPRWSYGGSKLIGELILVNYSSFYKLKSMIVRPHNFYGPRSGYGHVIPQFIERIIKKVEPFPIYGADNTRSFGYVDDAVKAMALLMEKSELFDKGTETIHLGGGSETTIKDLAEMLFKISGWRPKKIEIMNSPSGSTKRRCPDTSKLKSIVGFDEITSMEKGLKKTFEWYKKDIKNKI